MTWRDATKFIIICSALVLIIYDLVAYNQSGGAATISYVMLSWSKDYPILPFMFGVLCGHLFVPLKDTKEE